jgi:hypothetical protein
MSSFKATLTVLQNQVQEIDRLKVEHYRVCLQGFFGTSSPLIALFFAGS